MDILDQAQAFEQRERETAIAAHVSKPTTEGSETCHGCGEPIPEARRAAVPYTVLCVTCQSEGEL